MFFTVINIIIYLAVIGILYYLFVYVVDQFIPDPPGRMLKVVAVVVVCILVILLLLSFVSGSGVNLPKLM